jgi:hypothetical protein
VIAVSLVGAFVCFRAAADIQAEHAPPSANVLPTLTFVSPQLTALVQPLSPLSVQDVTIDAFADYGCRNPVRVSVDDSYGLPIDTKSARASAERLLQDGLTFFVGIGTAEPVASPAFQAAVGATQSVKQIPTRVQRSESSGGDTFVLHVARQSYRLRRNARLVSIQVTGTFEVAWLLPRGYHSCYLMLPDTNGAATPFSLQTEKTVIDSISVFNVSGFDSISTASADSATSDTAQLDPTASEPTPTDPLTDSWTCGGSTKRVCEGVIAVLDEPGATGEAGTRLFVAGALVGVFLTLAIDALRRFRRSPTIRANGAESAEE